MIPLLAGLAFSTAAGFGAQAYGAKLAGDAASAQQAASIAAYKNRHTWEVSDLRNAGLNPALSAMQGAGSVGSMSAAQIPSNDAGRDVGNAIANASARAVARAQVKNLEADTNLKMANSFESSQRANIAAWQSHSALERAKQDNMETQAMARDPDALWRTRYQSPLMRKMDDIGSSARRLFEQVRDGDPVGRYTPPKGGGYVKRWPSEN